VATDHGPTGILLGIVEDDPGIALLERRELERRGYRVMVFQNAADAFGWQGSPPVDCWLVDHGLAAGSTGLQFISELRGRGDQAPAVLVTGSDDPHVLLLALRTGVRDFVRKGSGFLELLTSRIEAVLGQARAERQLRLSEARAELEAERRRELEIEVNERRRAEQRAQAALSSLRDVDRRKDEFLAMLGHELRNPLAPIASAVEVLRTQPADTPRVSWAAAVIGRQINQLRRLVDDLLDVARIMNGRLSLKREPVLLQSVIEQAIERIQPMLQVRNHTLRAELPAPPIHVHGDPVRLVQVVGNLLDNAVKYTPAAGHIEVMLQQAGGHAELRVVDNGIGMDAETIDAVFGMFVQGPRSPDRAEGGLGLGLTLARKLVALHQGSVVASSDGLGRGSTFTMRLPVTATPAVERESPMPTPAAAPRRILVVDDNVDAAAAAAMLLELWGFVPTIAHDGEQALAALAEVDPDAVLLDIGLPRLDGYEVLARGREPGARPDCLWLAVSGYGQPADIERSRRAGFAAHLVKPVAPEALRAALEPLFRRRSDG
jgi:signal transduction histidine kinase